jgi:hypothetical protein
MQSYNALQDQATAQNQKEVMMVKIETEQIAESLHRNGMWLENNAWDGTDPVKAMRPNPIQPWTSIRVSVSLESIKNEIKHNHEIDTIRG